ncbi:hypothetical protein [Streptomyces tunisiensis]|uniref:hypothetical protein n=1 Tax=Streptomyces tunisiensis TaxID=948699 RepID=UPI003EE32465
MASGDVEVQEENVERLRLVAGAGLLQVVLRLPHETLDFDLGPHLQAGSLGRRLLHGLFCLESQLVDVLE